MQRREKVAILLLPILIAIILVASYSQEADEDGRTTESVPSNLKAVALYSDRGAWNESIAALKEMFQWMNRSVELVGADEINGGALDRYSILCMPGGDMYEYSKDLTPRGKEKIRDFILRGGGYMGICGGAYFASGRVEWRGEPLPMTPLGLYQGSAVGPLNDIHPYPSYGMSMVNIVDDSHPVTADGPENMWMLYYWGPALTPDEGSEVMILGVYEETGQPSIIAFEYGSGRVFLVGAHPEIKEDSDRDSSTWGEEMDDRESDWDLMLRAVLWLKKQ
jgi:glutamine amidotransferase-like uncharacterized protein